MTFLRKSGSLVVVWIKSSATAARCSFCSGGRSCERVLSLCFMPRSCVNWDTVVWEPPDQLLLLSLSVADLCWLQPVHVPHSRMFCLLQVFQNADHFQHFQPSLKHLRHTSICVALTASSPKAFWIIWIVSMEICLSLMQNFMQICCSTLPFWMWPPHSTHAHSTVSTIPPTSRGKLSLFMLVHSSLLSLAARLQWCRTNHSCYINNGSILGGQTSYISLLNKYSMKSTLIVT